MALFNRRDFFTRSAAGIAYLTLPSGVMVKASDAFSQNSQDAAKQGTLVIYLKGGMNNLFNSALVPDKLNWFDMRGKAIPLSGGRFIDPVWDEGLNEFAKENFAVLGVNTLYGTHPRAQPAVLAGNPYKMISNHIGGDVPIALSGDYGEKVKNFATTYTNVLDATDPSMAASLKATILKAREMSAKLESSKRSLSYLDGAYLDAISTASSLFKLPVIDMGEIKSAYGLKNASVSNFASKIAAGEVMLRMGANVHSLSSGGWDTHGDTNGNKVREKMQPLMPAINTFVNRMVADSSSRYSLVIVSEFNRNRKSGHGGSFGVTMFSQHVRPSDSLMKKDKKGAYQYRGGSGPEWGDLWKFIASVTSGRTLSNGYEDQQA